MRLAYEYRLRPTASQVKQFDRWLDRLRCQYNWLLAERFDWWELNRCPVNACPLVSSIAPPKEPPEYYSQKRSLVTLKQERSWYKDIYSQVLQDMVKRVKLAFDRYQKAVGLPVQARRGDQDTEPMKREACPTPVDPTGAIPLCG